jgi:DNA invertase Pin-like site-specific DNA recombinase
MKDDLKMNQERHKTVTPLTGIYVRSSTAMQNTESQRIELLNFCHRKGWTDIEIYEEKVSGVAKDRSEYKRLLDDCFASKLARVICYDLSRLNRSGVKATIDSIHDIQSNGVELISMKDGLTFDSQMGLVMASMLSAFANIDYELRREKQKIGIENARRKNGGVCPWGGSGRKKNEHLRESITRLKRTGMSVRKIAKTLKCSPTTVQNVSKELSLCQK